MYVGGMLLLALVVSHGAAWAQPQHRHDATHSNADSASHHGELHFSHPLVSESLSPDTKVRLDYFFKGGSQGGHGVSEDVLRFEAEYAFHRSFSIEAILPFRLAGSETAVHHAHVAFKFANFAFANHGVLLAHGLEIGLPGNHEDGIEHEPRLEIGPSLGAGYLWRDLELAALATFGIPASRGEHVETELKYNLSSLYHVSRRLQGLLELDGSSALAGEAFGETTIYITPGVKIQPWAGRIFHLGLGVSFQLSHHRVFDRRVLLSAFYHL